MSFFNFLINKALRLPVVPSLELLDALNYSSSARTFSAASSLDESNFDLTERPLDLRTFGAITPEPQMEDCMTSSELKDTVDADYRSFGIER